MKLLAKLKEVASKPVTATSAYSTAMYGVPVTMDDILRRVYNRIDDGIKSKSMGNQFSLVCDIDEVVMQRLDDIIKRYSSLGFIVKVIDKEIFNEIEGVYLFINWRNCSILNNSKDDDGNSEE